MIKVLHVMGCADTGGISSVVLNYYKHINREQFRFDFALTVPEIGQNGKELEKLGATFYIIPMKSVRFSLYISELRRILIEGNYDAIHVHENETSYVALAVAKSVGIKCRAAHSHTTSPTRTLAGKLKRLAGCMLNTYFATKIIGCGQLAGERVFGKHNMKKKKACILPNAIETSKFLFNEEIRREVRKELGIEENFVIGMVGRISYEKNNIFAVELFKVVHGYYKNTVMVVAGNGPDEKVFCRAIVENGLEDSIRFLGKRADVARLYQAFDVFLMPSLYEGFPVAAVEAMASGLPVLLSDVITRELEFGSAVEYLPLDNKALWVETIAKYINDVGRKSRCQEVKNHNLDINDTAKLLEKIYCEAIL